MKKRFLCVLLVLLLLVSILPFSGMETAAYYDTGYATSDYTNWKQTSTQWASASPWPGTSSKFGDVGCYITSVAILLRHYGVVSDSDLNLFNPLICNDALMAVGAITDEADLIPSAISRAYPGFVYAGTRSYSLDTLKSLMDSGYACIVQNVKNGGSHFIAIRSVSGSTVTMMDPGSSSTNLTAQYSGLTNIVYYKVSKPSASDTMSISGHNYPTGLQPGERFSICGTVSSAASSITYLTVGVYNSSGVRVTGATVEPYAKSYNLANVDSQVHFGTLDVGSYTYRIMATNGSNTKTVLNESFTVANDGLSISNYNYPTSLTQGSVFSIYGTITSESSNITSVTVGAYDTSGNLKTGTTVNPNAQSYDLRNADPYVSFGSLSAGTYVYKVIAKNAIGTVTLVNQSFTVISNDPLTVSDYSYPISLVQGSIFSVRGTVNSKSSNITSVTVGVYDTSGNLQTGATVSPNTQSYDLRNVDANVSFGILSAGNYVYKIAATNAAGTTLLASRNFTVTTSGSNSGGTGSSLPFYDVSVGSWYYDAVEFMYSRGVMKGMTDTTFEPETQMSRAMLVVSVYRLAGSPSTGGGSTYPDVSDGMWYTDAVVWATKAGIIKGMEDGQFHPNSIVTREQMVTIVHRYATYGGFDTSAYSDLSGYADAGQIQPYALRAMQWAVGMGLIKGIDSVTIDPAGGATRAQVAAILTRFFQTYA